MSKLFGDPLFDMALVFLGIVFVAVWEILFRPKHRRQVVTKERKPTARERQEVLRDLIGPSELKSLPEHIRTRLTVASAEHADELLRRQQAEGRWHRAAGELKRTKAELELAQRTSQRRRRERDELRIENEVLVKASAETADALVVLDLAAERVLEESLSGDLDQITGACHSLDETRGRIWAGYTAASRALKFAERERRRCRECDVPLPGPHRPTCTVAS